MRELEGTIKQQEEQIKHSTAGVKERMQPRTLFSNTFSYFAEQPEIQKIMVNTAIGFVLGYASRKVAELLNEKNLNMTVENLITRQLDRLETEQPAGLIAQGITILRESTPPDSPMYPFVRYK
jgi:hypothetical protein